MDFLIGCNYWDSENGTEMWKRFNPEVIKKDVEALSKYGVKVMRIFPIWRDFQPIKKLYAYQGGFGEYVFGDDEIPYKKGSTGVDEKQIENFITFADICKNNGINLIVSVLTGWMSGRLFVPPVLDGKNIISDPESLMWTERFIRGFVNGVKHCSNIIMWDLGNECNALGKVESRAEAYTWTAFVRNSIYSCDRTRPISSGMHSLDADENAFWTISDQGELTDYLTPHPYISSTICNHLDIMNKMRTTIFPTAQCMYYSDISGKPAILQEQGTFTPALGNSEMAADFARVNIYSAFANGVKGWLWWCANEQKELTDAPYRWSMIERTLGMLNCDRSPKPVAKEIKKTGEIISSLPFETLPDKSIDAVCVLSRQQNRWLTAATAFTLSKQAGLEIKLANCEAEIPKSKAYLLPNANGWQVTYRETWDFLKNEVYNNGADLYISFDQAQFSEFEEVTGLTSLGIQKSNGGHTASFTFGKMNYSAEFDILLKSNGAEVFAENEQDNPVLTKNKYGKGNVYFLAFPLEKMIVGGSNAFNGTDYYKIYSEIFGSIINAKPLVSLNPQIGLTLHKQDENNYIAILINYSDVEQNNKIQLADNWSVEKIIGDIDKTKKCDITVLKLNYKI